MTTGFSPTGLIAILRGLTPGEAVAVGRAVAEAGIGILEVPLNSPDPGQSISLLREALPGCLVGAGTVLTTAQVEEAQAAGAQLVVSPNTDAGRHRRDRAPGHAQLPRRRDAVGGVRRPGRRGPGG